MGDEKGFFLLDDPFLKADEDRLLKGVRMLKNFSQAGWQVIYFTAKKEILEAFGREVQVICLP